MDKKNTQALIISKSLCDQVSTKTLAYTLVTFLHFQ